jgi:hypothetical protein
MSSIINENTLSFFIIPQEIISNHILKSLGFISLKQLRLVCKKFNILVHPFFKPVLYGDALSFTKDPILFLKYTKKGFTDLPILEFFSINIDYTQILPDEKYFNLISNYESFQNLKKLDLGTLDFINDNVLKNLPSTLTELSLAYCLNITDEGLKYFYPNLKKLDLTGVNITNDGIKVLPSTLNHLKLSSCHNITDHGLSYLSNNNLTALVLNNTKFIGKNYLLPITLKKLDLGHCYEFEDQSLKNIPYKLEKLNLSSCLITDEGLKCLPSTLKNLYLNCCNIKGMMFKYLPSSITLLDLTNCQGIELNEFKLLSQLVKSNDSKLNYLNLSGCKQTTNDYLKYLPSTLRHLILEGCDKITDDGIKNIPLNLTYLDIKNCRNITNDGLEFLKNSQLSIVVYDIITQNGVLKSEVYFKKIVVAKKKKIKVKVV